jgi:hypothetical protein
VHLTAGYCINGRLNVRVFRVEGSTGGLGGENVGLLAHIGARGLIHLLKAIVATGFGPGTAGGILAVVGAGPPNELSTRRTRKSNFA